VYDFNESHYINDTNGTRVVYYEYLPDQSTNILYTNGSLINFGPWNTEADGGNGASNNTDPNAYQYDERKRGAKFSMYVASLGGTRMYKETNQTTSTQARMSSPYDDICSGRNAIVIIADNRTSNGVSRRML
jgi:hypothetical protein